MAYSLDALIGKDALVAVPQIYPAAQVVRLHHGLQMLPLTSALRSELLARSLPEVRLRWEEEIQAWGLPSSLGKMASLVADLASQLSEPDPVAYVEADFFGGVGGQSAIVWQQGRIVLAYDGYGIGAINKALRYLGVQTNNPDSGFDEFLMVGLARKRDTEKWGEVATRQEVSSMSEWEVERLVSALAGAEKALSTLDPKSPVYQLAEQQKKWAEQRLAEARSLKRKDQ